MYLWDMEDQLAYVVDSNSWLVTGISTVGATSVTGYTFTRESSNYTEELASDFVNGSTVWTTTLNLMFTRREALKSRSIKILADGQRYLGAIVKDENGLWWVFQDLQLSASGEGSGSTREEGSKYSVTLIGKSATPAHGISGPTATAFITTGTGI